MATTARTRVTARHTEPDMTGMEPDPRPPRPGLPGRASKPVRPFLPRRAAPATDESPRVRRDRRGRGLRSPLLPVDVPASRTRAQRFDQAVLEAVAELEGHWPGKLEALEFAVDEVPGVPADGPESASDEVVLDSGVPLTRFLPPGMDARGRPTKARIVVYRRPLEVRAGDAGELGDLVAEVLGEQLAAVLGEPDEGEDPVS
ncbi:hypothetical protein Namu_4170 [Nakamurella multipartita DSM 44233]|uniref:Zinicin-like metallopeptidase n=2 Tax=Nakamurella TaxID=53460 RepID=C8XIJ4_NAKMY|nr:hypothetical protein Namu_4170 [Nakamurella multipartita DSM 44233]